MTAETISFSSQESRSWSLQFILEKAIKHLLNQGCVAADNAKGCAYRIERCDHTLMCAAGPFIPDSELSRADNYPIGILQARFEERMLSSVETTAWLFWEEYYSKEQLALLLLLQRSHDFLMDNMLEGKEWIEYWKEKAQEICFRFNLNFPSKLFVDDLTEV